MPLNGSGGTEPSHFFSQSKVNSILGPPVLTGEKGSIKLGPSFFKMRLHPCLQWVLTIPMVSREGPMPNPAKFCVVTGIQLHTAVIMVLGLNRIRELRIFVSPSQILGFDLVEG